MEDRGGCRGGGGHSSTENKIIPTHKGIVLFDLHISDCNMVINIIVKYTRRGIHICRPL